MVGAANPTFFRSPLIQRGTKKTWIWQGEKIAGGLDESGAQNQRTRSCLKTCYQQRRETYAGRCVTNRGERRGDCSEIYLHSFRPRKLNSEGLMDGLEGGEADGRRRRKQAARPTTGEQAHRQKHSGQRGGRTNGSSSRRPRQQTQETGGPADERRTGAQTETRTDREVDGQKEAQVADHVS